MINPVPPFHSDVTIVMEDSCNCSCYPCRRWSRSPDKEKSTKEESESEKTHRVISTTVFSRIRDYISRK